MLTVFENTAVVSFRENMNPWLAMGIAAVFSLPLLLLHISRILNVAFACRRALPLAVFTLGVVINGVYAGGRYGSDPSGGNVRTA